MTSNAVYVAEIVRAFGLEPVASPDALRARLRNVKPVATAGSVGAALDALVASARSARESRSARQVRRHLAELDDLVAAATYARTKRAERARVLALLIVVFDLGALVGVDVDADDPENALKLIRRARR